MEFKIGVVFQKNSSCIAHGHDERDKSLKIFNKRLSISVGIS